MVTGPLFDAATRQVLRDVNNSVTNYAAHITLEAAARDENGDLETDRYGNVVYGAPVELPALIAYTQQATRTATGEDVISGAVIRLSFPPPTITIDDRITLPDGEQPKILSVQVDFSDDPYVATRVLV